MFAGWRDRDAAAPCGYGGFESVAGGSAAAAHGARTRGNRSCAADGAAGSPARRRRRRGARRAAERAARDGDGSEWYVPPPLGGEQPHVRYGWRSRAARRGCRRSPPTPGISYNGHFTGNDFDRAMVQPYAGRRRRHPRPRPRVGRLQVEPRVRQPATAKAALRSGCWRGCRLGAPRRRAPRPAAAAADGCRRVAAAPPCRRGPTRRGGRRRSPPRRRRRRRRPRRMSSDGADAARRVGRRQSARRLAALPPRPALGGAGAEVALGRS